MSSSTSSPTIQLTGGKAILVILAVVVFGVYRYSTAKQTLSTEGREVLETWIAAELLRPILADTTVPLAERGEAALGAARVSIREMHARGSLDDMVVRVELEPSDDYPPNTELIRYYRMSYSQLVGWQYEMDSSALSYHLAFF